MKIFRLYATITLSILLLSSCGNNSSVNPTGGSRTVITLAGDGTQGFANGTGIAAKFNQPSALTIDPQGNLHIADSYNSEIRKVTTQGVVTTPDIGTDPGNYARFTIPRGITSDVQGNIYVSDMIQDRIRKITPQNQVSTLAGSTAGVFKVPYGLAMDSQNNIYVADHSNHRIRRITPQGIVTTLAGGTQGYADGSLTVARFNFPLGVAVDAQNNIYVSEISRIRKITPQGTVSTLAGNSAEGFADGQGTNAQFKFPFGITLGAQGDIYVADAGNHRIRKITQQGEVTTVAGSVQGNTNGSAETALFNTPHGIAVDAQGNIYVADTGNHRICVIK